MLQRRLQVLIDDEQHGRIVQAAEARGLSVGAVVRDAIDRALAPDATRRRAAGARLLDAEPMPVPAGDGLLAELEELRGRRG